MQNTFDQFDMNMQSNPFDAFDPQSNNVPDFSSNIKENARTRLTNAAKALSYGVNGIQTLPESAMQIGGQAAGAVLDIPTEAYKSAWGTIPQTTADYLNNSTYGQTLGNALLTTRNGINDIAQQYPRAARNIEGISNLMGLEGALKFSEGLPNMGEQSGVSTTAALGGIPALPQIPTIATNAVKTAVVPLTESGRNAIAARLLTENAQNPQTAITSLRNAPEYIPQSYPTTGPASGDTGLLGLERTLRADPNNYFSGRIGEQNIARNATMNATAGNEGDIANAIKQRSAVTSPLYENARNVPIAPDAYKPILENIDAEIEKAGNTSDLGKTLMAYKIKLEGAMPSMAPVDTGLVDESGSPIMRPTFDNTLSGPLSQIYREERDQLQKSGLQPGAYAASVKGVVKPLNYQLGKALEAQSPDLANANQQFSIRSRDINSMQNMQDLTNKLTGTTRDTAGNYMYEPARVERAMKTGGMNTESGWQDFAQALDPNQQHYLQGLQSDLARDNLLNSPQVKPIGSPTYSYTAGAGNLNNHIADLLQKTPIVGNFYKAASADVKNKLIAAMLDPNKAADMISATLANSSNK